MFYDTGQLVFLLISSLIRNSIGVILNGAPDSYARYPKWAHSFENSLSLELKTRQPNGLLLYCDDGNVNDNFYAISIIDGNIQLDFRLGDNANDFGARRPVNTIRIEEVKVNDDKWHTLTIFQSWENVKLELDNTLVFKILNQRSFVFGNILKNSDVFVGGVPPDAHVLPSLSSPLRRYTQHLAVNVRNLMYRQYPQGMTSPQLIEAVGNRQSEDDHCRHSSIPSREKFSCLNDGLCFSTNNGAKCDCTFSDHEGKNCETEKSDAKLTFSGNEWVGYDVSPNVSAVLRTKTDNLTLTFKTVHGSSMLFFAGDKNGYLHVMLHDGAIIATSKLEGSDARIIRMFNVFPGQRYDDDSWHSLVLERSLQLHSEKMRAVHMTLMVDGRRDEIRQYAPEIDWITNSFAYLGSIPVENPIRDVSRVSFRGCMKKVKYEMDGTQILFVHLADQGFGRSVIRTGGDLSFACSAPGLPPDVLSFIDGTSYLTLPKWNSLSSGSISFHFRTTSEDGLVLYHGVLQSNASDYIAFEIIDSHLFMIINLGSGVVRLQTTAKKINDGEWHHVMLDRTSRSGSVVVDATKTEFSTPGVSSNLIVDDLVYIGNVPRSSIVYPSSVWSISLQKGYVGCIKNIRFNGISTKMTSALDNLNSTGIELGCPQKDDSTNPCEPNPCENFGKCRPHFRSFTCDCTNTNMEGTKCDIQPTTVQIREDNEDEQDVLVLPSTQPSQAEHVHIRFKTDKSRGVLLDSSANLKNDRFCVFLENSQLHLLLQDSTTNNTFAWGKSLSDNQWHYLQVRRLGERLLLFLDGSWGHSIYLKQPLTINLDEIGSGISLHPTATEENFKGYLSKMTINGKDLLVNKRKTSKTSNRESKGQRNIKTKHSSVSFTNSSGFIQFSSQKIASLVGTYRIQFKFQTLMHSSLLLVTISNQHDDDAIRLQLYNGRIRYTYRTLRKEYRVTSPKLDNRHHLSDMRWHNVLVYEDDKTGEHVMLIDNTTTVLKVPRSSRKPKIVGDMYIGGIQSGVRSETTPTFRGCFSSLRVNDNPVDMFNDADEKQHISKGCSGPIARCSENACANGGRCVQLFTSIKCKCHLTAHSGQRCQNPATTVRFDGEPSAIYYEFPDGEQPANSNDFFVFALKTTQPYGVLVAIDCKGSNDFLTIFLKKGFLHVRFNLGSTDHIIGYYTQSLNDGHQHVVRVSRVETNVTLKIDKLPVLRYRPTKKNDLVQLNMQNRIVLGASFNTRHLEANRRRRSVELFDSYQGEISGVNVNGIQLLELMENDSKFIHTIGSPQTTFVSDQNKDDDDSEEKAVIEMHPIEENPNEALIESLAPSCLSIEEQQSCFIDSDETSTGFFSPVLPSSLTSDEDTESPPAEGPKTTTGRSKPVSPTAAPSKPTLTALSHTSTMKSGVVFLEELDSSSIEGSADDLFDSPFSATIATKPVITTTIATTTTTTTTPKPTKKPTSTVLPRPYNSVAEAESQNPDYLGSSIWNNVDTLPAPMVTGPAWRTHKLTNTTIAPRGTSTTKATKTSTLSPRTTVVKSTERVRVVVSTTTQNPTTTLATTAITTTKRPQVAKATPITPVKIRQKTTTPHFSVYPVRPTTPMGISATSTIQNMQSSSYTTDFPRTPLIMGSSLAVIFAIAAVVFFVFKCRQQPPASEHYPMAMNVKTQSGYTPIAAELTPPMSNGHDVTQPLLARPQVNGNGYQPLNGSVIPKNGLLKNGATRNGNGVAAKKKDFKEWYV